MVHRILSAKLFFVPIETRVPLKFGTETLTSVTCARVCLRVQDEKGRTAEGWGETPLSVQWVWPSTLPYEPRHQTLKRFCVRLAEAWPKHSGEGHALEVGYEFQEKVLPRLLAEFNARNQDSQPANGVPQEPMPHLAALVCSSPFDVALHDAFGKLVGRPVYETYRREFLKADLAAFLQPANGSAVSFSGLFPNDFLTSTPPRSAKAWHLLGGLDPIEESELSGNEPHDGHPILLRDWIRRDGLKCVKVKLRGNDAAWDYHRLVQAGKVAVEENVEWLSADFNCTVREPAYVNGILDRLRDENPRLCGMILYVEQPFPYELERDRIDVHSVSTRKPLFLDESAHDWRMVRLGRELGWTGVALKTCKTQTGAILSACWAKAHGMALMVQDLTNPMIAQIPHLLLAAHAGTIMGVETNAMQFYPAASDLEAKVHPGLYQRREGVVDLCSIRGPGFGYRLEEISRALPDPAAAFGS
jgi:L-alanine-DL-glutamate epimerase-like enolase superfamily enzyme